MSAHTLLKARTAAAHAAIDAEFSRFDLGCCGSYTCFLLAHARVLPAIEGILLSEGGLPQWRQRTALLAKDLRSFGHDLPNSTTVPQAPGLAESFGLLYVLEGSRLGGHLLSLRVGQGFFEAFPFGGTPAG